MTGTGVDVAVDVSVLEALEFLPACGGEHHPTGEYGHNPEEHASWHNITPCGFEILVCNSWAMAYINGRYLSLFCYGCGHSHPVHELRFIPIGTP